MNNICLLTVPGWSNIDSWLLPLEEAKSKLHFNLFVVSPSPWVLAKLSNKDELGERLSALDAIFLIQTSHTEIIRVNSFTDARNLSRIVLLFEKLRLLNVPRLLTPLLRCAKAVGLLQESVVIQGDLPIFKVVLSDVDVFSSNLTRRDERFLQELGKASFFSLWHGTAQLSSDQKKVLSHRIRSFSEVRIFSTGPSQTEKYAKYFQDFEVQIYKAVSPRLAGMSRLREQALEGFKTNRNKVLFINRDPRTIFQKWPIFFSTLGIARLARISAQSGVKRLLIKLHPNQSRVISSIQLLFVRLYVLPTKLRVEVTKKHTSSLISVRAAFTWFSGVAVDLLCAGVPVYELRSTNHRLGPSLPDSSHWNFLLEAKLTRMLSSEQEIFEVLDSSGSVGEKTLQCFDENFSTHFFFSNDYPSVGEQILSKLS